MAEPRYHPTPGKHSGSIEGSHSADRPPLAASSCLPGQLVTCMDEKVIQSFLQAESASVKDEENFSEITKSTKSKNKTKTFVHGIVECYIMKIQVFNASRRLK